MRGRILLLALVALGAGATPVTARPHRRPSFVLILTDDQRWDMLDGMPAVQKLLVDGGISFARAFVPTSLCCPSRASILTGQYAHTTGVLSSYFVGADGSALDETSTIATWLSAAGYRTGFFGKYMNDYSLHLHVPPGWTDWYAFYGPKYFDYYLIENGTPVYYGNADADYSTDVLAKKVVRFIRSTRRRPFFVWFAPYAPHDPATPAPRHAGRFDAVAPFRPPSYDEADAGDKPWWVQHQPRLTPEKQAFGDELRRKMLASLLAVDDAVAAITAALRRIRRERDTVVILISDNGFALGEHRYIGKQCPYEECARVPLIIRYPALVKAPRTEMRFAVNVDLAPTIAELAGVVPTHAIEGRSLVPLLDDTATEWRSEVLGEHWGLFMPTFASVRGDRWKYVEYLYEGPELYDLREDPFELQNVAADPEHAGLETALAARLRELYPRWPWDGTPPPR